jgi:hypothetical protein
MTLRWGLAGWRRVNAISSPLACRAERAASQGAVEVECQPRMAAARSSRVLPAFIAGVRYEQVAGDADTEGQVGGILVAYGGASRELWRLRLYKNARRRQPPGDRERARRALRG